jgi:hypothetical protein
MPCTRQCHPVGGARYIPRVRIGCGRVSTREQHPAAQHDALTAAGCDAVFVDASGKLAHRPELEKALLSANRVGDRTNTSTAVGRMFFQIPGAIMEFDVHRVASTSMRAGWPPHGRMDRSVSVKTGGLPRTVTMGVAGHRVNCRGESGRAGRDRDPVARHANLETATIPTDSTAAATVTRRR